MTSEPVLVLGTVIGSGSFGTIYATDHDQYVCKRCGLGEDHCLITTSFVREIAAIRRLAGSQSVINYQRVVFDVKDNGWIQLFLPRYQCDLGQLIEQRGHLLHPPLIKLVVFRVLQGLYNSAFHLIAHRDLKPENILISGVDGRCQVVICDWGISRYLLDHNPDYLTGQVQSLQYRCPELLLGQPRYNGSIDLWSVGVIMAEMYHKKKPIFPVDGTHYRDSARLNQIFQAVGTPTLNDWPELAQLPTWRTLGPFDYHPKRSIIQIEPSDPSGQDLLDRLLAVNPAQRISLIDAMNHPYFDSIRPSTVKSPSVLSSLLQGIQPTAINCNDHAVRRETLFRLFKLKLRWFCSHQTYFLAMHYFDAYLNQTQCDQIQLLLPVSLMCLSLATKVTQVKEYTSKQYLDELGQSGHPSTIEDLINLQIELMQMLDFNLYRTTEYQLLKWLGQELQLNPKCLAQSIGLLYLASMDSGSRQLVHLAMGAIRVNDHDWLSCDLIPSESTEVTESIEVVTVYLRQLLSRDDLQPIQQEIWQSLGLI